MTPDPLDLPVQRLEFTCRSEIPVSFWPWDRTAEPFEARLVRALEGPPPGPVYFRILDDYDDCPHDEFQLEAVLWGRRAVAAGDTVREGIRRLAEELRDPAAFRFEEREPLPARTLRELAEDLPRHSRRLTLTLETPLNADGVFHYDDPEQPPFDLPALIGHAARQLAWFDLTDRGDLNSSDFLTHADTVAEQAIATVAGLERGFCTWEHAWVGDGDPISIGWLGHCEFERPRPEVWPWLLALTLGRAGRGRDRGFGAISLWVQAGP